MKNSNDSIGNRARDLPACSAVPQPFAPPAACPYMPAGILLNVNAMIYFKFELQLKFRNNKNYYFIIVNFPTDLRQNTLT
jgi:hypothetical protein